MLEITFMNISFQCNNSTETHIITISISPVIVLHEKKESISFFTTSFSHDLLPNTHDLFVTKANKTANNHAPNVPTVTPTLKK